MKKVDNDIISYDESHLKYLESQARKRGFLTDSIAVDLINEVRKLKLIIENTKYQSLKLTKHGDLKSVTFSKEARSEPPSGWNTVGWPDPD